MFQKLTPITRNIIILNVVVYLLANMLPNLDLYNLFSANYPLSPNFKIWQVITHMFMHAQIGEGVGITHIIFNMLTLWSFGTVLEQVLGPKKYIILYFASGILGYALNSLFAYIQIQDTIHLLEGQGVNIGEIYAKANIHYQGTFIPPKNPNEILLYQYYLGKMLGASGAVFGVIAAFTTLFPDSKMMIMFIPFPIKAKILLGIIIVVSLILAFTGQVGGVAHFAHIGGALAGFLLAKYWKNNRFKIN